MATMPVDLEDRVRRILIDYWDPIGFEDVPRDEYDGYGRVICSMIVNSRVCELHEFAYYLTDIARDMMGFEPQLDRIQETARELLALRLQVR
jgi:hypothetical protein